MCFQIIFNAIFSAILLISLLTVVDSWSCFQDAIAVPVIPSQVAGVWYEIARLPSSEVPACLKVIAPASQLNGNYTLELDYINNVNKGWKPTKESLIFPWNEVANGNFNLHYSDRVANMNVQFKYLGSMRGYSVACGYTDFAAGLSIVRILSRTKLINNTVRTKVDLLAKQFHIDLSELTWVQQDGRCNGSVNLCTFNVGLLVTFSFLLIFLINTLWI